MIFYNDVLYACMKRVYGNEDLVGVPKCLVKQEVKVRKKLDLLKKNVVSKRSISRQTTASSSSLSENGTSVNPISEILFLGMTMKAWLNYSKRVGEKMKAAQENGFDYISSDSDQNDSIDHYHYSKESQRSFSSEEKHNLEEDVEEAESKEFGSYENEAGSQNHSSSKINFIKGRSRDEEINKIVSQKEIPSIGEKEDRSLNGVNFGRRMPKDLISPSKRMEPDSISEELLVSGSKVEARRSLVDLLNGEKLSNISPVSGTFDPQENNNHLFGPKNSKKGSIGFKFEDSSNLEQRGASSPDQLS